MIASEIRQKLKSEREALETRLASLEGNAEKKVRDLQAELVNTVRESRDAIKSDADAEVASILKGLPEHRDRRDSQFRRLVSSQLESLRPGKATKAELGKCVAVAVEKARALKELEGADDFEFEPEADDEVANILKGLPEHLVRRDSQFRRLVSSQLESLRPGETTKAELRNCVAVAVEKARALKELEGADDFEFEPEADDEVANILKGLPEHLDRRDSQFLRLVSSQRESLPPGKATKRNLSKCVDDADFEASQVKKLEAEVRVTWGCAILGIALMLVGLCTGCLLVRVIWFPGLLVLAASLIGSVYFFGYTMERQGELEERRQNLKSALARAEAIRQALDEERRQKAREAKEAKERAKEATVSALVRAEAIRQALDGERRQKAREAKERAKEATVSALARVEAIRQALAEQVEKRCEFEESKLRAATEIAVTIAREEVEAEKKRENEKYKPREKALADDFARRIDEARKSINNLAAEYWPSCIDFKELANLERPLPDSLPAAIRFGAMTLDLSRMAEEAGLNREFTGELERRLQVPALLAFPKAASLMIEADESNLEAGVDCLRAVALRILGIFPSGQAQFTFLDPTGRGHNFRLFMELLHYDEVLVGRKVFTELPDIQARLRDLCDYIDEFTQKKLGARYADFEEYNKAAGSMRDPYRFLAVACFPARIQQEEFTRLVDIAEHGPRCGVYVLMVTDSTHPIPEGCSMEQLRRRFSPVCWNKKKYPIWNEHDFCQLELRLDSTPSSEVGIAILTNVGKAAVEGSRHVDVPFQDIAPSSDAYWQESSQYGIDVPIGKHGMVEQRFRVGWDQPGQSKVSPHHALIAGRTSAGKTNLLHCLITSIALRYPPTEVELYLLDFREGTGFQRYAKGRFPHARVIGLETDPEFGLGVLKHLNQEMQKRASAFKAVGADVDQLSIYRNATSNVTSVAPMPRILLVFDEFQRLFDGGGTMAEEAKNLIENLARQGRGYGIHLVFATQSISWAEQLSSHTLDQMGVRIALQSTMDQAERILGPNNRAAAELRRAGEAIYNDQNQSKEGNTHFQVAFLDGVVGEKHLGELAALLPADSLPSGKDPLRRQKVFRGRQPAEITENRPLDNLLNRSAWPAPSTKVTAWLGEVMALEGEVSTVFARRAGANLLVVAREEENALGVITAAVLSVAAHHPPVKVAGALPPAQFHVLLHDRLGEGTSTALRSLADVIPRTVIQRAELSLEAIDTVVRNRMASYDSEMEAIYLILFGLQWHHPLVTRDETKEKKWLKHVVTKGSEVGVHTMVWGDPGAPWSVCFDSREIARFETKVLFQMSGADSYKFIDSQEANNLGVWKALYTNPDLRRPVAFRPYGIPNSQFLSRVGSVLSSRNSSSARP